MLYETTEHFTVFLACVYGGLAIGLVYDAFKLIRKLCGDGIVITAAMDFTFWIAAGLIVLFVSVLANGGAIRLYMALGHGAGCIIFKAAISPLMSFAFGKIDSIIKKAFGYMKATALGKKIFK